MAALAASPDAAASSARAGHHLRYKDMILSAIEVLKDTEGSSLKEITKFIVENFSDLPSSHATLVGYHLRRLRSNGEVVMLNHLYKLPSTSNAGNDGVTVESKRRGRPPKNTLPDIPAAYVAPKRRGRPPKLLAVADFRKTRKPGRPPKTVVPKTAASAAIFVLPQDEQVKTALLQIFHRATTIFLPDGFSNSKTAKDPVFISPSKIQPLIDASTGSRKPGRPLKADGKKQQWGFIPEEKRKPGRPRMNPAAPMQGTFDIGVGKRKPGRPRKMVNTVLPRIITSSDPLTLKKAGEPESPASVETEQDNIGFQKKGKVGRPRKHPFLEGLNTPPTSSVTP